jgi:hypothetical protein
MCHLLNIGRSHEIKTLRLTEKGCAGINKANEERKLDIPKLVFSIDHEILVHKICRSRHTNPKSINTTQK